ncbi:uncharacterized protein B0T23DRAFT_160652 [Neurospora hispaniola]|uniref:Uncharacterized protein n=1 Tax=Neurospora hispaniola TaxID=588809 RepID=A0AAJ0I507_9PEZI|nr:hypothetical protein B0T23DRAFT_160652 [Neurospora hispaniola]
MSILPFFYLTPYFFMYPTNLVVYTIINYHHLPSRLLLCNANSDSGGRRGTRGKERKGERERKDILVSFFVSCRHSHTTHGHPHTLSHLHMLFYDFSLWRYSLFERYQVLFSLHYLTDQTTNYLVIHHPSVPHLSHILHSAESRQRDAGQFSIVSHTSTTAQRSVMS